MAFTSDKPSPVPTPTSLVVKNGSKMRSSTCGAIPVPVSRTRRRTKFPLANTPVVQCGALDSRQPSATVNVPLVFIDPTKFQRALFAQEKAAVEVLGAHRAPVGDAHRYVLEVTRSAEQASEVVRAAWAKYKGKDNRDLRLLDLDKVAALIEADFPTRLYYVPLRNSLFDTHVNQAAPHDRQLEYCSDAIAGFFQEMKRIGRADDVVMYVYSEFGRRVPENTSLGTDHGTSQVNFVIGNTVKGGLYGKPPSLSNLVLMDNLETTTDFRQVYATLIEEWLGVDNTKVLGQQFKTLGMFKA